VRVEIVRYPNLFENLAVRVSIVSWQRVSAGQCGFMNHALARTIIGSMRARAERSDYSGRIAGIVPDA
jgi:hypothetical protein